MHRFLLIFIFLLSLQNQIFSQGQYLVTKSFISQFDSTLNNWTPLEPIRSNEGNDEIISFYNDSIYYKINESIIKQTRKARNKKRIGFIIKGIPYVMAIKILDYKINETPSCYSEFNIVIVEKGQRFSNDYFTTVNNTSLADMKLISCENITMFRKGLTKNASLLITVNQVPNKNTPYSKWRFLLEICRLPSSSADL